jgi:putative heme-binding domain-containing protein
VPIAGLILLLQSACYSFAQSPVQDTPEVRRIYEQAALTADGDPEQGRRLFFEDNRTKCSVCHRVNQEGGLVGPEMTQIGGKFDRPHLIESILEPSRQIVEGFRSTSFQMNDGSIVTGIVKERSAATVKLVDAAAKSIELSPSDIEREKINESSIMPSGIANGLSQQEFTDLIAYLESLRGPEGKFGAGIKGPLVVPDGFKVATIATGMTGAVALETLPDGRVLLCEQTGSLRVIRDGHLLPTPFVSLQVDTKWERGLIGVTIDPNFAKTPYVYVCYVAKAPYTHHVISRFLADGDVARPGTEQILLEGDDQGTLGGNVPAGHQGGAMHFGPDGCLYIGLGEQTNGPASQRLDTLQGKILRMHSDGSIPKDNPLLEKTKGKYQAIWAYGLRNPFTFAIHPSGDMLINDVGGNFEEINRGVAGGNYGWSSVEHGPSENPEYVDPIHIYPQASISGGVFVPSKGNWPEQYRDNYLFADFVHGWIHMIDPKTAHATKANTALSFASGFRRPVDMRFDSSGKLYVLLRNAWVIDNKFQGGTSSLVAISRN